MSQNFILRFVYLSFFDFSPFPFSSLLPLQDFIAEAVEEIYKAVDTYLYEVDDILSSDWADSLTFILSIPTLFSYSLFAVHFSPFVFLQIFLKIWAKIQKIVDSQ